MFFEGENRVIPNRYGAFVVFGWSKFGVGYVVLREDMEDMEDSQ